MARPKITALTPAQETQLAVYRDRWRAIGLSTALADRRAAEAAVRLMYECAGLTRPRGIVWCGSPLSQGLTRAIVLDRAGQAVWASVWDSVGASVRDSVRDSVWDSVGASVWDSVGASVGASVGDSVRASVYGQHDAHWLAFYEYFREVCGLTQETDRLQGLLALAQSAGWALPHVGLCWIAERHTLLARDDRGRIHSTSGPAIAYPDGWAIYAVHGVRVPEHVVVQPGALTPDHVLREPNAEVRRVMVEQMGRERFLAQLGVGPVQEDRCGKLYRVETQDGDEPFCFVEVLNATPERDGTHKRYLLAVPPETQTAREGIAWTFDVDPAGYEPVVET